ncbi:MAG: hypothetical protein IPL25_20255 [Saprospiraceae bacterium]|nr:hypothetical protein [Candidatus Vicinibacter affinis]
MSLIVSRALPDVPGWRSLYTEGCHGMNTNGMRQRNKPLKSNRIVGSLLKVSPACGFQCVRCHGQNGAALVHALSAG